MKDILVLVASKFEDTELISAINIFNRSNLSLDLVSIENLDKVKANRYAIVETLKIKDVNLNDYQALYLPGGPGHQLLANSSVVINLVKDYATNKKLIGAICAAPLVLDKANLLKGQKVTAFGKEYVPSAIYVDKPVVRVNDYIWTGRDYLATPELAFKIVKALKK